MKKLLWMTLLLLSSTARAALLTFDVSGAGSLDTVSNFAGDPNLPSGTNGLNPFYGPYFIGSFGAGSSVTVETDRNGNGLDHDWLLVSGTLKVDETLPFGALGSIVVDETLTLSGGEATESGGVVLWSHYALTHFSEAGTWRCVGAPLCGPLGIPDGTDLPIAILGAFLGYTKYDPMYLGEWLLAPNRASITTTTNIVDQVGDGAPIPSGQPAQWIVFGEPLHEDSPNTPVFPFPMPQPPYPTDIPAPAEPGSGALGLLCAGALAYVLRRRTAS